LYSPPKNKSLRNDVANEIINSIVMGELKPGDRIIEQVISENMKISRAPIREALRDLESQGIIVAVERRGSFVAKLTNQDIAELFSLRSILEGFATRLATSLITVDDIKILSEYTKEMKVAANNNDPQLFLENDINFHQLIIARSEHRRLIKMLNDIRALIRLFMALSKFSMQIENQLFKEAETHQEIINAIEAHDSVKAESVTESHIIRSGEMLLEFLSRSNKSL
jgi:DNA-binding GntR family transcriptional regulator